jgi:probable HAF family extracellular repeat protein
MTTATARTALVFLAMAVMGEGASALTYNITRIGTFGGTDTRATDINDHGQVVGCSFLPGNLVSNAFLYDGTAMTRLDGLAPGSTTFAHAINNRGEVVGHNIEQTTFETSAVLWTAGGITDLGADLGAGRSTARDINDHGLVVGQAAVASTFSHGFIWDRPGGGQIVGTLEGRSGGSNLGVNNDGVVVGHSFFFGSPDQAHLVTRRDGHYESQPIGAPFPAIGFADAINDHGMIVGRANRGDGPHTAVIFTPGAGEPFVDLGPLPGALISAALDVNEAGTIVGSSGGNPNWPTSHAFVFANRRLLDLNDLFVDRLDEWDVLVEALAINNHGDIVGYGITSDGNISAFVLVVPEPPTAVTLGLGLLLGGIAWWGRCRRRGPSVSLAAAETATAGKLAPARRLC